MHAVMVLFVIFHSANVNNHHSTVISDAFFFSSIIQEIFALSNCTIENAQLENVG